MEANKEDVIKFIDNMSVLELSGFVKVAGGSILV